MDPSPAALKIARIRFDEILSDNTNISVSYCLQLEAIPSQIDLAIIATNADVRMQVIKKMLSLIKIKYMIIEKVAFQTVEDCVDAVKLFNKKKIGAWVNCPRRLHPLFSKLKDNMVNRTHRFIKVRGSKLGLASNAIHMLDLFSFLFGDQDISVNLSKLHPRIYPAKRKGFIEIGGTVTFKNNKGDLLSLTDNMQKAQVTEMEFGYNKKKLLTIDNNNKSFSQYNQKQKIIINGDFIMPLQSDLTRPVLEEILNTGSCGLTPLDESMKLHIAMLKGFIDHISKYSATEINQEFCPIT